MHFPRLSEHGWCENSVTQRREQETFFYTPSSVGVGRTLCSTPLPPNREGRAVITRLSDDIPKA